MAKPLIHPNWNQPRATITDGYSLEMTAKDVAALNDAAPLIPIDTPLSVTFLPGEEQASRVAATVAVRQADVSRCFIVAGDPAEPMGPYFDTMALIKTGAFERAGVKAIGIGGHPEGHPVMSKMECSAILSAKIAEIEARGMAALIVTQFGFDPDAFLAWLSDLRASGIDTPVRIGIPGPASIKSLLRFAARCGVGASTAVMKKYGVSITNLLGSAGPDKLVDAFAAQLGEEHGRVRLHFYPFGGLRKTVEWIAEYERRNG